MFVLRALLLVLCFTLCSARAFAQSSVTDGVLINADNMFRDLEKKTVRLKGNVQVVFNGQHLSCDKATIDLNSEQITAEGHVIMNNEKAHIEGDKIVFNYKQSTGYIYNGFVQSGQVVFEGEIVEKVGDNHYIATNAEYTACETCPPGWSFSGRKIDAEIGGYARIQRPVFRIGGVPILILPSLVVPLKSARQSGFLVPSMDFSQKGGVALSAIYFWAIDKSQDMTLTARWYRLRGFKALDDYRYVLSKDSHGRLQTALMEDRAFQVEAELPYTPKRWFLTYEHIHELPEDYVHRADLHLVSDLRYTRDFPEEIPGHGDPALENKLSITKLTDAQYGSAEVDMYINLLKQYPLQGNEDAVHRFPEIRYSAKEQRLGEFGPLVRVDLDYVNFARDSFNYDDLCYLTPAQRAAGLTCPGRSIPGVPNPQLGKKGELPRDGHFDRDTDLMRAGQRLDIQPNISYPFQIARKFDVLPSVMYRETQYRFSPSPEAETSGPNGEPGFNSSAARRYVQTDMLIKTEFSRVYGDMQDPKSERWKHAIEPEVGFSEIPWMRRPNHPFFGTYEGLQSSRQYDPISDTDIYSPRTGLQFDYNDRTYERQVVNFAINNRITKKVWNDGTPDYRTSVLFRLSQAYDFNEARRQGHPWSWVESLLDMRFEHFETYTTAAYNGYAHVTNTSSRVRVLATPKNFFQVSFTQNFILDDNYNVTPNNETRNIGLGAGFVTKYLEAVGIINYSDITHKFQDWSYGLNIRPPGRCWVIRIDHTQVAGGDAPIHASLNFDFGGETPKEASTRNQAM